MFFPRIHACEFNNGCMILYIHFLAAIPPPQLPHLWIAVRMTGGKDLCSFFEGKNGYMKVKQKYMNSNVEGCS